MEGDHTLCRSHKGGWVSEQTLSNIPKQCEHHPSSTDMASSNRRVLVNGGGPAGAVTAFWLAKGGFEVVVTERSMSRPYGQGVDVTGRAVDIIKKMGLEQRIRDSTTGEAGLTVVDDQGEDVAPPLGTAPIEGGTASVTQEIEIMRRDLTKIFVDAAEALPNVTFRYGCTVDEVQQHEKSITAVLSDTGKPEDFTAIIGADGLGSAIRKLTFDPEINRRSVSPTNTYVAFFSIPGDPKYVSSAARRLFPPPSLWPRSELCGSDREHDANASQKPASETHII